MPDEISSTYGEQAMLQVHGIIGVGHVERIPVTFQVVDIIIIGGRRGEHKALSPHFSVISNGR